MSEWQMAPGAWTGKKPAELTMRDYFAVNLVPCIWEQWLRQGRASGVAIGKEFIVREAYEFADAMLMERANQGGPQ